MKKPREDFSGRGLIDIILPAIVAGVVLLAAWRHVFVLVCCIARLHRSRCRVGEGLLGVSYGFTPFYNSENGHISYANRYSALR